MTGITVADPAPYLVTINQGRAMDQVPIPVPIRAVITRGMEIAVAVELPNGRLMRAYEDQFSLQDPR